ncbi:MAG: hypothetical protein U9Q29_00460 [Campylobacterota bacterium]|nr:hypothetical protein [Campylobacterota bacterium]
MLEDMIEDAGFSLMMQRNIEELVLHFFEKEQNFGILCRIEDASFEPVLPKSINAEFRPLTLFFLAGYTFETARIVEDSLVFEAGFGTENVGSLVSVPLLSIMQVIIDETPVLINLSTYKKIQKVEKTVDKNGVKNSMASFLSNPENSKFIKK